MDKNQRNRLVREAYKRLQALERMILNEEKFFKDNICNADAASIYFARQTIRDVMTKYERDFLGADGVNTTVLYGETK
jgi:hypothetical protein